MSSASYKHFKQLNRADHGVRSLHASAILVVNLSDFSRNGQLAPIAQILRKNRRPDNLLTDTPAFSKIAPMPPSRAAIATAAAPREAADNVAPAPDGSGAAAGKRRRSIAVETATAKVATLRLCVF